MPANLFLQERNILPLLSWKLRITTQVTPCTKTNVYLAYISNADSKLIFRHQFSSTIGPLRALSSPSEPGAADSQEGQRRPKVQRIALPDGRLLLKDSFSSHMHGPFPPLLPESPVEVRYGTFFHNEKCLGIGQSVIMTQVNHSWQSTSPPTCMPTDVPLVVADLALVRFGICSGGCSTQATKLIEGLLYTRSIPAMYPYLSEFLQ